MNQPAWPLPVFLTNRYHVRWLDRSFPNLTSKQALNDLHSHTTDTGTMTLASHLLTAIKLLAALAIVFFIAATVRLLQILPPRPVARNRLRGSPCHTLIVLGSGGHTAEMFALLRDLDPHVYNHRTYIISSGDAFSAMKAQEFEEGLTRQWITAGYIEKKKKLKNKEVNDAQLDNKNEAVSPQGSRGDVGSFNICVVPRARRVHQSLLTTPFSALNCLLVCLHTLNGSLAPTGQAPDYPDLILANGPATAAIVVLASLILRFFNIRGAQSRGKMRTIYVESWARVKKLSLTGKLLVRVVDRFLVQWEELEGIGGRAEFRGVLIQ